jgi:hypothetical protein
MSDERRRSPRVEVVGRVHGRAVALDVPITVREISLGGMSIDTPVAFEIDSVHHFSLTLGDGSVAMIAGRVRYSRQVSAEGAEGSAATFLTGLEFIEEDSPGESPFEDVMRRMK